MTRTVRTLKFAPTRWAALSLVGLMGTAVLADTPSPVIENGITRPSKEISLRFKYQGLVAKVNVEEGAVVKKGDIAMVQDTIEEALERDAMITEAMSKVTVQAAEAGLEEKKLELQKVQQIHDGGAQNDLELAKAKTDVLVAELQVAKEQQDLDVKKIKLHKQEELLNKMKLVMTEQEDGGIVQSVGAHEGEMVDPSKPPVLTIILNNPLQVEVQLGAAVSGKLKMGRTLRVSYDKKDWKEATIYYLAPMADAASGLQTVKLKLKNPEGTASGAQIYVEIPGEIAEGGRDAAAVAK